MKRTQEDVTPQLVVREHESGEFTRAELAALRSRGQIDKNVPEHAMKDIAAQYRYYLGKGRPAVCQVAKKAGNHLEYAKKVFKSRGMPEELANLAVVESGYRTNAVSRAGAAGAWQFMPETGLKYGLVQDQWQDDRLDPYKSTEAAADYLGYLYNYFGDWPTAIAAYNAGEGKMSRAKAGTGSRDFFEVKMRNEMLDDKAQLREETQNYVPRFLAVTKIMRNLPELGFDSVEVDETARVSRLKVAPGTDLNALSSACALPWKDFADYNQHHKRNITCTSRETFVYVPNYVKKQAVQYLAAHDKGDFAGWKFVKAGKNYDSLEKLGKLANISPEKLRKANPEIKRLKKGMAVLVPPTLKLPVAPEPKLFASSAPKATAVAKTSPNARAHKISANETLYAISRKYNIDAKILQSHNAIKDPGQLKVGDIIKIPALPASPTPASYNVAKAGNAGKKAQKNYVVQAKDNLWSISRKFNVSVDDLKRWNKLNNQNIKVGAVLALYKD